MRHILIIFLAATLISTTAWAEDKVCVSIDETADGLSENDRKAVLLIAKGTLSKLGATLVDAPCDQSVTLASVRLGSAVIATVNSPKGTRKGKAQSVEELAELYDQLLRALWKGEDADNNASNAMTRNNVDVRRTDPLRVKADNLWTMQVGAAAFPGISVSEVPLVLGLGGTYELDSYAFFYGGTIAFTFGNDNEEQKDSAFTMQGILGGRYFLNSENNNTPYLGGGLTVGFSHIEVDGHDYSGGGLGMNAHVGYALARASTIRIFFELGVDLPFYDQELDDKPVPMGVDETLYAPVIGLTIGAGFGPPQRSLTVRHRSI